MKPKSFTIGFLSQAWNLYGTHHFSSVVDYVSTHPELTLRDMRYLSNPQTPAQLEKGLPPWTGLVDGVITNEGIERDAVETANWMLRGGVPVVNISSDLRDPRIPYVHTSNTSIGTLAARHLLELHLKSFVVVGYVLSGASKERFVAFDEYLRKHGHRAHAYDLTQRYEGLGVEAFSIRDERALIDLIDRLPKPMGVLAINDGVGRLVCQAVLTQGLAVPDDVAILGVGDSELCRAQTPSLSSICTPRQFIGHAAARLLHQILLDGEITIHQQEIPADEVVARQSTLGRATQGQELDRAIEYIRLHACDGITVEDVLQTVTISRRLFEQLFTARVGVSPGKEIQRLRLAQADQCLRQTNFSIQRIAEMVGFSDTSSFSKFYKRQTGIAPSTFRPRE